MICHMELITKKIDEISVLIVGTGSIGRRHVRVLRSLGIVDIRICDPDIKNRNICADEGYVCRHYSDLKNALDDRPDTVFICTPPALHIPQAIEAMKAGSHVFCEKPLSDSLEDVKELKNVISDTKRIFTVGYCFRFHEGLMKAKRLLDNGELGHMYSGRFRMSENLAAVRPDYMDLFTLRQGGVFDLAHEIDLAFWFTGGRAKESQILSSVVSDLGFTVPDITEISILTDNGKMAGIHLDYFSLPRMRRTEIIGSGGTVIVDFPDWDSYTLSVYKNEVEEWEVSHFSSERDDMFKAEDRAFLEAVITGGNPLISVHEAEKSLVIVSKGLKEYDRT